MPIKLGGGGSGLPMNSIVPMNISELIHTEDNGSTWLRSGTVSNDLTQYPLAAKSLAAYFKTYFSTAAQETTPKAIAWNGAHFWVIGLARVAYQYDAQGAYTGVSKNISPQVGNPTGITWDGAHYWVVDAAAKIVKQFDSNFSSTGVSFSTASEITTAEGLAWDGSGFWIAERGNGTTDQVFKYDTQGVYTGKSHIYANQSKNAYGVEFADGHVWVVTASGAVLKIHPDDGLTGDSFDIAASSSVSSARGITWDGQAFWIIGANLNVVSKFERYVGMPFRKDDPDSEKPLYVRVA